MVVPHSKPENLILIPIQRKWMKQSSMCCRHGLVLRAANIHRGETYRVIAFLQWWALQFGILFFCYDVICRYWPFAKKLGNINARFACLTTKMNHFLSRFHEKAHAWSCQVPLLQFI